MLNDGVAFSLGALASGARATRLQRLAATLRGERVIWTFARRCFSSQSSGHLATGCTAALRSTGSTFSMWRQARLVRPCGARTVDKTYNTPHIDSSEARYCGNLATRAPVWRCSGRQNPRTRHTGRLFRWLDQHVTQSPSGGDLSPGSSRGAIRTTIRTLRGARQPAACDRST